MKNQLINIKLNGETVESGGTGGNDSRPKNSLSNFHKMGTLWAHLMNIRDFEVVRIFVLRDLFLDIITAVLKVGLEPTQSYPHMPLKV